LCVVAGCTLVACGDDEDGPGGPAVPPHDASTGDSGEDAGLDAGPREDASAPDASTDAATDSSVDSGPDATIDGTTPDATTEEPDDVPSEWTCLAALWNDEVCDCGCSVHDVDCFAGDCTEPGCIGAPNACESCFTQEGTWKSCTAPPDPDDWSCDEAAISDATCDCGCDAPDPACGDEGCTQPGCRKAGCFERHGCEDGVTDPATDDCSAYTPEALMSDWFCPWDSYGGGDGCDCGCGSLDPDCAGNGCSGGRCFAPACDRCNDEDGRPYDCAAAEAGWDDELVQTGESSFCDPAHYANGDGCDCGCGGIDPDCDPGSCAEPGCSAEVCDRCTDENGHPTGCAPPEWTAVCPPQNYGTGDGCDCGCGIDDPDCGSGGSNDPSDPQDDCDVCHDRTEYDPGNPELGYVACPAWTCSGSRVADDECDCGCGALDPFCRFVVRLSCSEPGCSTTAACDNCTDAQGEAQDCDTWGTGGTTCDVSQYGVDGLCDCGCGIDDPDCGDVGCAAEGCIAPGCDVCHDGTSLAVCDVWHCELEAFSDDDCDCGCGAIDPACAGDGCKEPGCRADACEVCHDPYGRVVTCPTAS
jgi:hypothetical protein